MTFGKIVASSINGVRTIEPEGLRDEELPVTLETACDLGSVTKIVATTSILMKLIEKKSQHLVFGEFSSKFASAAKEAPMIDEPQVIKTEPGSHPLPVVATDIDTYALTHNETSTGVMMPIIRPKGSAGALTLVDATSAAGGLDLDISQSDCYYFAPQKSFASDGGLWIAIMSPAAIASSGVIVLC